MLPKDSLAVRVNPSGVVMLKATINDPDHSDDAQEPKMIQNSDDAQEPLTTRERQRKPGDQGYLMSHMGVGPQETPKEPPVAEILGGMGRDSFALKSDSE